MAFLLAFPSRFVIAGPLKSAGSPSVVLGLLALLLCVVARLIPQLGPPRSPNPVRTVIVGFLALCATSFALAQSRGLPPVESSGADRFMVLILALTGTGLLLVDGLPNRARLEDLLHVLLCAGYVNAFVAAVQFLFRFDPVAHLSLPGFVLNGDLFDQDRSDLRRANGTSLHAIELGVVLGALLPLAIHLALHATSRNRRRVHTAGVALTFLAAPMSVSRSGVVALVVGLTVYAYPWPLRRIVNGAGLLLAGLVLLRVFVSSLTGTLKGLFLNTGNDTSIAARTFDYKDVEQLVLRYPVFGRGVGTFRPTAYFTLDNQYLGTLVEGGVVMFFALIGLFIFGAATAREAGRRVPSSSATKDLAQALAAGMLVLGVSAAFFDEFSFRQAVTLFWVLLGLAGALWRMAESPVRRVGRPAIMEERT